MSGLESLFWAGIREDAKDFDRLMLRRVENLLPPTGYPDVDGLWLGEAFKLELKAKARPARPTTGLDLGVTVEQALWNEEYWRCGGSCWFYVRVGKGPEACKYLVRGRDGRVLLDRLTEASLERLSVLPPRHTLLRVLERVTLPGVD